MKFSKRTIDLLQASENIAPGALAAAAAEYNEQKAKAEQAKALKILQAGDFRLQNLVSDVRRYRKQMEAAKVRLKKFDSAYAQFIKDGDFEKFVKDSGESRYTLGAE
jgi:hypothetical protein